MKNSGIEFSLIVMSFIIGIGVSSVFWVIVSKDSIEKWKTHAVESGVAEFYIGENFEKSFRWIVPEECE